VPFNLLVTSYSRTLVRLDLGRVWTNLKTTITAFESTHNFLPQPTVTRDMGVTTHIPKLQFADPKEQEDPPIEVLIGSEHYWKFVRDSPPLRISPSIVLLPSNLGWILSGNRSGISANWAAVNLIQAGNAGLLPDPEIKRLWELETIGITPHQSRELNSKDSDVLRDFHDFFRTEGNRRVVSLPKKANVYLPNNRQNAAYRFKSLVNKLSKNAQL